MAPVDRSLQSPSRMNAINWSYDPLRKTTSVALDGMYARSFVEPASPLTSLK
jgi:hypothetical protein